MHLLLSSDYPILLCIKCLLWLRTRYHYITNNVEFTAFKAIMNFSCINLTIPFATTIEIPRIEFAMVAVIIAHLSPFFYMSSADSSTQSFKPSFSVLCGFIT